MVRSCRWWGRIRDGLRGIVGRCARRAPRGQRLAAVGAQPQVRRQRGGPAGAVGHQSGSSPPGAIPASEPSSGAGRPRWGWVRDVWGALRCRVRALGLLATASHAAQQVLDGKLLDGFTQLLQRLDLAALVIEGWRTYTKLIEAAHRSRSTPKEPQKVVLSTHQITSTHHPTIDVIINETQRYTARLTVTITFDLRLVRAIVQNGALVALEAGSCLEAYSRASFV